jgi:hypothetical protein
MYVRSPSKTYLRADGRHSLALVIARTIATGWSTYSLWRTLNLADRMEHLIEGPESPCQLDLLAPYFSRRFAFRVRFVTLSITSFADPQSRAVFSRLRTLPCTGMRSFFPYTFLGVSSRYSLVSLTVRRHIFTPLP